MHGRTCSAIAAFLFAASSGASAQNPNDLINIFGGVLKSAIAQATIDEWRKVPLAEIDCIDRELRGRGQSIHSLVSQGQSPNSAPILEIRRTCRSGLAGRTNAASSDSNGSNRQYAVMGLSLGDTVNFESSRYKDFKCAESDLFSGYRFCRKAEVKNAVTISNSILLGPDDRVSYVNSSINPAALSDAGIEAEIDRLSSLYKSRPRVLRRSGEWPHGVIALWGQIDLMPLPQGDIEALASGGSQRRGLLLDFIGNIRKSASAGYPIYVLSGGAGYAWSASVDENGRGSLRFLTADASSYSPRVVTDNWSGQGRPQAQQRTEETAVPDDSSSRSNAEAARRSAAEAQNQVEDIARRQQQLEIAQKQAAERAAADLRAAKSEAESAQRRASEAERKAQEAASNQRQMLLIGAAVLLLFAGVGLAAFVILALRRQAPTTGSVGSNELEVRAQSDLHSVDRPKFTRPVLNAAESHAAEEEVRGIVDASVAQVDPSSVEQSKNASDTIQKITSLASHRTKGDVSDEEFQFLKTLLIGAQMPASRLEQLVAGFARLRDLQLITQEEYETKVVETL